MEKNVQICRDSKDTEHSAIAIIVDKNKVLIVQRSSTDYWMPLHWSAPGGHIEKGESPHRAIKREIKEETGLDTKNLVLFRTKQDSVGRKLYLYKCEDFDGEVKLNFEHSDFKWISIDEMDDLKTTPNLKEFAASALGIPLGYY